MSVRCGVVYCTGGESERERLVVCMEERERLVVCVEERETGCVCGGERDWV